VAALSAALEADGTRATGPRGARGNLTPITSGKEAAKATLALMRKTTETTLQPRATVDAYIEAGGKGRVAVQDGLWRQFGTATADAMADGARLLASIWESAWNSGDGDAIHANRLQEIDTDTLMELYEDPEFVKSLHLEDIASVLK